MKNEIRLNGKVYTFKESFDVNLLLSYENTRWGEWEIVREFLSNALDSVIGDISKITIVKSETSYIVQDAGSGYPVFYAKRIGASNKRDNSDSIGQFGEGTKLAILTCVRNKIDLMLCSQNWLIIPYAKEAEGQEVLFYDIYEADYPIEGSIICIESNANIDEIFNNLGEYFLAYSDITALYSYAVNVEEINRDRNLISDDDLSCKIRDIYEKSVDVILIQSILKSSALPYEQKKKFIEFQASFYTYYPEVWMEAFQKLYGSNALLGTNDIASREAEALGYVVINSLDYSICRILKEAGIREDINCLADDFEFVWAETLTREERSVLEQLPRYARIAGFNDIPEIIRVFDEYKNHGNVNGVYDQGKREIYLKRELLNNGLEKTLKTYLHESCHHVTKADDLDRRFADQLCNMLTNTVMKYITEVGIEYKLPVTARGIELPDNLQLSAMDLSATISAVKNELIIKAGRYTLKTTLLDDVEKSKTWMRKVTLSAGRFTLYITDEVKDLLITENSFITFQIRS